MVRALDVSDWVCWDSLIRGDAPAFIRQDAVGAQLWEFGICTGLLENGRVLNTDLVRRAILETCSAVVSLRSRASSTP